MDGFVNGRPATTTTMQRHRCRGARLGSRQPRQASSPATSRARTTAAPWARSCLDEGADIILPVAGPVGLGTAAACAGARPPGSSAWTPISTSPPPTSRAGAADLGPEEHGRGRLQHHQVNVLNLARSVGDAYRRHAEEQRRVHRPVPPVRQQGSGRPERGRRRGSSRPTSSPARSRSSSPAEAQVVGKVDHRARGKLVADTNDTRPALVGEKLISPRGPAVAAAPATSRGPSASVTADPPGGVPLGDSNCAASPSVSVTWWPTTAST